MNLQMRGNLGAGYRSASQKARVVTQAWGKRAFYCAICNSPMLDQLQEGQKARDFLCPRCQAPFELKSQGRPIGDTIRDGAWSAMKGRIEADETPNLFVLHYDRSRWTVRDLLLVPHFALSMSAIERCRPLKVTARRARWRGCNILLGNVPDEAKIPLIVNGRVEPTQRVRKHYRQLKRLKGVRAEGRGWVLDVLRLLGVYGLRRFETKEAYAMLPALQKLHPKNHRIREKIRQQLQILANRGFLRHLARGKWEMKRVGGAGAGRSWLGDVFRLVRSLGRPRFTTKEAYAFVPELERLHPGNRHVRDKIRQQLQILRDQGFLKHLDRGEWALKS